MSTGNANQKQAYAVERQQQGFLKLDGIEDINVSRRRHVHAECNVLMNSGFMR